MSNFGVFEQGIISKLTEFDPIEVENIKFNVGDIYIDQISILIQGSLTIEDKNKAAKHMDKW